MRKTARPVVWEGDGAQSPSLYPIAILRFIHFYVAMRRLGLFNDSYRFGILNKRRQRDHRQAGGCR